MTDLLKELEDIFANNVFGENVWNNLLKRYSLSEILSEIACGVFNEKCLCMDEVVYNLKDMPDFKVRKTAVKTIGTFYTRMYNGGVEKVISLLTDIWIKSGYRVVLLTDEEPSDDDYYINENITRIVLPSIGESPDKDKFRKRCEALSKVIEEYRIDAMVYHAWLNNYFVFDETAIKSTGIPLIVYAHGTFSTGLTVTHTDIAYMSATQEKSYSMCDTVVTLSSTDREWWSGLGLASMQVVNPPSYSIKDTPVSPLDSKTVLWIGRFSKEKQIFEALKAVKIAHETVPDLKMLILGKGESEEYTENVKSFIANNGMSDYVFLRGYMTDIKPFYKEASLTLMTSKFEGFPMVAVESAVSGVPIVLYELPNLELVRNNSGVSVVPQRDTKALGDKIAELLSDENLLKEKGKAIRNDIEKMYSRDLGEVWKEIFEYSLSEKPKALPKYKQSESAVAQSIIEKHIAMNIEESNTVFKEQQQWINHLENDITELKCALAEVSDELDKANSRPVCLRTPIGFAKAVIKKILRK